MRKNRARRFIQWQRKRSGWIRWFRQRSRKIGRIALVVGSFLLLMAIVFVLVLPLIRQEAGFRSNRFFINSMFDQGMSTIFDMRVANDVPYATIYLSMIEMLYRIESCPQVLVVTTGRSLMMPYESVEGAPDAFDADASKGYLTLYDHVPDSDGKRFMNSIRSESGSQVSNGSIAGFAAKCKEVHAKEEQPFITMSGADAVNLSDNPIVAETLGSVTRSTYFYPFDRYELFLSAVLAVDERPTINFISPFAAPGTKIFRPDAPNTITPNIMVNLSAPAWEVEMKRISAGIEPLDYPALIFQRPLAIRILALTLFLVVLVVVAVVPFVTETSSVLEITLAILFSLWGFRSILLPEYLTRTTIIDHGLLSMYLLLVFALVVRFGVIPLWQRLGGE